MTAYDFAIRGTAGRIGDGLTPDQIKAQRDLVEFLVCAITRRWEQHFGSLPDELLAEHNADVWKTWKALDRLSLWAGGKHAWGDDQNIRRTDYRRSLVIGTCNRLYAQVEDGAHVAGIAIAVHTVDGSEITYYGDPGESGLVTVVHMPDHEGCAVIGNEAEATDR